MGRVQRLYRSLYQASRKIKNIQEDAQRDVLTGCFNRRYVLAVLEFDDSSSVAFRPGRRALDGFGPGVNAALRPSGGPWQG